MTKPVHKTRAFCLTMTPIESIYEIESNLRDLKPYLHSRDIFVVRKARIKYKQLVDRFFREHGRMVDPERCAVCLNDDDYFLRLLESTRERYYTDGEYSP